VAHRGEEGDTNLENKRNRGSLGKGKLKSIFMTPHGRRGPVEQSRGGELAGCATINSVWFGK